MNITVYHNPACGTSRNVLALLESKGIKPTIIEYLKTPPTAAQLKSFARQAGGIRALLREKAPPYAELGLADTKWTEDQLIAFILEQPILLNRPLVVTDDAVKLCRPAESVLELLD